MYCAEEKETTCVYDYVDDEWIVYSCVPRHMTKLKKVAGEPYWTELEEGEGGVKRIVAAKWKMKGNQIRFFSELIVTEAQTEARKASGQRLSKLMV
ncbi:MAG: hypothetical protein K6T85_06590 [Gorillibacterium sp.]|nr:hypothetical protein [Gorillibacterium sp.]